MTDALRLINDAAQLASAQQYDESVDALKKALEADLAADTKKAALLQLSVSLMRLSRYDEAEFYLLSYNKLCPGNEAYDLLAILYESAEDIEKALEVYEKMRQQNPDNAQAMIKIITLKKDRTEKDYLNAIDYMDSLIASGALKHYNEFERLTVYNEMYEAAKKLSNPEKALFYYDDYAAVYTAKQKEASDLYKQMLAAAFSLTIYSDYHTNEKQIEMMREIYSLFKPKRENVFDTQTACFGEINIGFLSSDLQFHPVGRFLLSLFRHKITNSGTKYFCYDTNTKRDEDIITEQVKKYADRYVFIGKLSDNEAEALILKDNLDIFFDMNGISANNKRELIIRRLAPVQLTWIGFPCTSAIRNVDYTIVDPVCDPYETSRRFYTERLAYMSKTFLCYPIIHNYDDPALKIDDPPFLKNGYITFASFSKSLKFSKRCLRLWGEILRRLPTSKLLIRSSVGTVDETATNALKRRFKENEIDISRVVFLPTCMFDSYLSSYNDADIILDTYPFNGATTTCDAFIMGVPVVSLYGEKHLERVGLSMLGNVGLSDLAAATDESYVEVAVNLANDTERLITLRKTLRETFMRSPLTDTVAFKVEFESLMRKLHIMYRMKNKKAANAHTKEQTALISEILRGFYFIEHMFYDRYDSGVIKFARNELYILQKELCGRLAEGVKSTELFEKYKKAADMFSADIDYSNLKQLSAAGASFLNKLF